MFGRLLTSNEGTASFRLLIAALCCPMCLSILGIWSLRHSKRYPDWPSRMFIAQDVVKRSWDWRRGRSGRTSLPQEGRGSMEIFCARRATALHNRSNEDVYLVSRFLGCLLRDARACRGVQGRTDRDFSASPRLNSLDLEASRRGADWRLWPQSNLLKVWPTCASGR